MVFRPVGVAQDEARSRSKLTAPLYPPEPGKMAAASMGPPLMKVTRPEEEVQLRFSRVQTGQTELGEVEETPSLV